MNPTAPPASEIVTDPRRQRQILMAMCTALVAVVGSVSILNLAQQDLAVDLGASQSDLLWIINGFTIALAALLLQVGEDDESVQRGDRPGHQGAPRPRRLVSG